MIILLIPHTIKYHLTKFSVNLNSFIATMNITMNSKSEDLPCFCWILQLHKMSYKQRYFTGSSTCSTQELSIRLMKVLSAVKKVFRSAVKLFFCSGIYHILNLKIINNYKSRSFSKEMLVLSREIYDSCFPLL